MPTPIAPAGLTPLGLFVVEEAESGPRPVINLADKIDPQTQDLASMEAPGDIADEMVLMAISAVRFSSPSLLRVGQRFGDVKKLDDHAEALLKAEGRTAVKPVVELGLVEVDSIDVLIGGDWFEVTVGYFNLLAGDDKKREAKVQFPIGFDEAA